jgi:hypothetical protein
MYFRFCYRAIHRPAELHISAWAIRTCIPACALEQREQEQKPFLELPREILLFSLTKKMLEEVLESG